MNYREIVSKLQNRTKLQIRQKLYHMLKKRPEEIAKGHKEALEYYRTELDNWK